MEVSSRYIVLFYFHYCFSLPIFLIGFNPILFYIIVKSGLVGVLIVLSFGQLMPELIAAQYPLRFVDMYGCYSVVYISLFFDAIGVGHCAWLIHYIRDYMFPVKELSLETSEKPAVMPYESLHLLLFYIICLLTRLFTRPESNLPSFLLQLDHQSAEAQERMPRNDHPHLFNRTILRIYYDLTLLVLLHRPRCAQTSIIPLSFRPYLHPVARSWLIVLRITA